MEAKTKKNIGMPRKTLTSIKRRENFSIKHAEKVTIVVDNSSDPIEILVTLNALYVLNST